MLPGVNFCLINLHGFVDNRECAHEFDAKAGSAVNEQVDAWTAHKTDTGVVYYYNAVTGESTYNKPVGFKGEVCVLIAHHHLLISL